MREGGPRRFAFYALYYISRREVSAPSYDGISRGKIIDEIHNGA